MQQNSTQNTQFIVDNLYDKLKKCQYQNNASILINIIEIKGRFNMNNYQQPMYVDAKKFIKNYLHSIENMNYGYDCINEEKIFNAIKYLELKEQLELLFYTKRFLKTKGFCDNLIIVDKRIVLLRKKIALKGKEFFKFFSLWMSSSIRALFLTLFLYSLTTTLIMLPAPVKWMGIFKIQNYTFYENEFINSFLNSLLFMTGGNSAQPIIEPSCPLGVIVYVLIISLFYLIIVNFVFRKIENYVTNKYMIL